MVKRKHDKQTRAFISYAKKWLSCDKYSRLLLDSTDGQFKAEVISECSDNLLIIEISLKNSYEGFHHITTIQYSHDLNKWSALK